jgi:hypothetical protein
MHQNQHSSKVVLNFGNSGEGSAMAIGCVRTKESTEAPGFADPSKRGLYTEHGKNLLLHPDKVGFESTTSDEPTRFMLDDAEGVILETPHSITIIAKEGLLLAAPKITLTSPTQVAFYSGAGRGLSGGAEPPTVVSGG